MYNYGSKFVRIITVPLWICLYIICSPIILMFYICMVCMLNRDTFTCNGVTVHTKVRQYKDDYGRTVVLVPMTHMATKKFYERVEVIVKKCNLILTEGVNDRKQKLPNKLNYGALKDITGLNPQKPFKSSYIVNADGDISDLSENTIAMIKVICKILDGDGKTIIENFKNINKQEKKILNKPTLMNDILDSRNIILERCFISLLSNQKFLRTKLNKDRTSEKAREHVNYDEMFETLDEFKQLMPREQHICIPWGAKHMSYFQELVEIKNFTLEATEKIYVLNIVSVFFNILLYPLRNK